MESMSELALVTVPYHLGERGMEVGRGPLVLMREGLEGVAEIHPRIVPENVLEKVGVVNKELAGVVGAVVERGAIPLVVAGNCNSCLGTLAGIQGGRTGIVWLDAHGDFHTPETSTSGFLDGMALAAAIGDCHGQLCGGIGFRQEVRADDVVLLGVRDLDEAEERRLAGSPVRWRRDSQLGDALELLDGLARRVDSVYLHVDVDFLDASESPGVNYRGAGGVRASDGEKLIVEIARRVPLRAVGLTNYNPDCDPDLRTCQVVLGLLRALREEVTR
jgi:arginase